MWECIGDLDCLKQNAALAAIAGAVIGALATGIINFAINMLMLWRNNFQKKRAVENAIQAELSCIINLLNAISDANGDSEIIAYLNAIFKSDLVIKTLAPEIWRLGYDSAQDTVEFYAQLTTDFEKHRHPDTQKFHNTESVRETAKNLADEGVKLSLSLGQNKGMKKRWKMIAAILAVLVLGGVLAGPIMSDVERPDYEVISSAAQNIELRRYAPMIIAQVTVEGAREQAIGDGFRLLADYIFGNNTVSQEIAMTAPVQQQASEKIAMTAPVQQQAEGNAWTVSFVMPSDYTMETLPKPNNERVTLKQIPIAGDEPLSNPYDTIYRWVRVLNKRASAS